MFNFGFLYNCIKTYKSIEGILKFLKSEDAPDISHKVIEIIGKQEFNAAIECLKHAEISNNPEREINGAINIFRVASERCLDFQEPKIIVLIYISLLYNILNEDSLKEHFLNEAKKHFDKYIEPKVNHLEMISYFPVEIQAKVVVEGTSMAIGTAHNLYKLLSPHPASIKIAKMIMGSSEREKEGIKQAKQWGEKHYIESTTKKMERLKKEIEIEKKDFNDIYNFILNN